MKFRELLEVAKQLTNINNLATIANDKIQQSKSNDEDLVYAQTILNFSFDAKDTPDSNSILKTLKQCALATEKPTSTLKPLAIIMDLKQSSEIASNPAFLTFLNQAYDYINEKKASYAQLKKIEDTKQFHLKQNTSTSDTQTKKLSVKELSGKLGALFGKKHVSQLRPQTLGTAVAPRSITTKSIISLKKDISDAESQSFSTKEVSLNKPELSLPEPWQLETERKKIAILEEKFSQLQKNFHQLTAAKQQLEKENEKLTQHLKITEEQREKYVLELQSLSNPVHRDYQLVIADVDKEKLLEDFAELIVEDKWFDYLHHVTLQLLSSDSQRGAKNRVDELYKEYKDINTRALFSIRGKVDLPEERPSRNPIFNEQLVTELSIKLNSVNLAHDLRTTTMKEADETCKPFFALLLKRANSLKENSQLSRRTTDPFLSDTALLNKTIILRRAEEKCINMIKAYEDIHSLQKKKEIPIQEASGPEKKSPRQAQTLFVDQSKNGATMAESMSSRLAEAISYSFNWAFSKSTQ